MNQSHHGLWNIFVNEWWFGVFIQDIFMLTHVSEQLLESEPPAPLCSLFGNLEEMLQC